MPRPTPPPALRPWSQRRSRHRRPNRRRDPRPRSAIAAAATKRRRDQPRLRRTSRPRPPPHQPRRRRISHSNRPLRPHNPLPLQRRQPAEVNSHRENSRTRDLDDPPGSRRPFSSADAGSYYARACHADGLNSMWTASATTGATAYAQCPAGINGSRGLYVRNVASSTPAGGFSNAKFSIAAPPGSYFDEIHFNGNLFANRSWQAGIFDRQAGRWVWCGPSCTWTAVTVPVHVGGFAASALEALVICGASQCVSNGEIVAGLAMREVTVRVQDVRNPAVGIAGGTLSTAGWKRGVQSVAVAANDNTGIRRVRAFVDGVLSSERGLACDDRYLKPCPASPVTSLGVDVSRLAEGPHRLDVHAIDSGNNVASAARTIYVDNRAPDPPEQLTAIEPGWVAQNSFSDRVGEAVERRLSDQRRAVPTLSRVERGQARVHGHGACGRGEDRRSQGACRRCLAREAVARRPGRQ